MAAYCSCEMKLSQRLSQIRLAFWSVDYTVACSSGYMCDEAVSARIEKNIDSLCRQDGIYKANNLTSQV